jgi:hypothetical protein
MAGRLFDFCPPQDVANNPQVFLAGVVELFEAYPPDIVERAVSVVHGLPSKYKWAPRPAEIKEFLEELMAPIRWAEERAEIDRQYRASLPPPEPDRSKRPTYEELQAQCARGGLFIGPVGRAAKPWKPSGITDDDLRARYPIRQAEAAE